MCDRNHLANAKTRRQRPRHADREATRLARRRVLGILERREHADAKTASGDEIGDARIG
jgi:hypothetical protein